MAATVKAALLLSRFDDFTLKTLSLQRPLLPATTTKRNKIHHQRSVAVVNCLFSGVDGGGVADDFVFTRKSNFSREFSVIAEMLKRIEPLDTSIISNGVSAAAKAFMTRTISDILGVISTDEYPVTIRGSRQSFYKLFTDTIITGYTLWNTEYRVSLMRNFELSIDGTTTEGLVPSCGSKVLEQSEESECEGFNEDLTGIPQSLGELSPEALNYIHKLKSELGSAKKELNAWEQGIVHKERSSKGNLNLLQYLRSFERDRVSDLARPSSSEVEEIIHQLVRNILERLFIDDTASSFLEDPVIGETENDLYDIELCDTVGISRDYLGNLLFWCMMLGHHLRGLENRLHLSCAVGLL